MYIDCFGKAVLFLEPEENLDQRLLSSDQVEMSLMEKDQISMMFFL